jgi:hypothetical protein
MENNRCTIDSFIEQATINREYLKNLLTRLEEDYETLEQRIENLRIDLVITENTLGKLQTLGDKGEWIEVDHGDGRPFKYNMRGEIFMSHPNDR